MQALWLLTGWRTWVEIGMEACVLPGHQICPLPHSTIKTPTSQANNSTLHLGGSNTASRFFKTFPRTNLSNADSVLIYVKAVLDVGDTEPNPLLLDLSSSQ